MREKGGLLTVRTVGVHLGPDNAPICPELKPGPYVRVTVTDTGHGMEEATLARIFDPYFTTKDKQVGTGLGLAVVHGLVRKHGGAITVESAPGQGATFAVYFPVIQTEPLPETQQPEQMVPGHERILLVDDERSLVEMGRQMLEHLGYQVETCTGSVEALAQFRERPDRFDLVVTDMTMPNLTGDRLAIELLRIRPDIPIVVCTGYSERILEEKARAIGIKALVNKPVTMAQMARAIRKALTAGKAGEERGSQSEEAVPPGGS
jgi:two-component system cell cycle sensor histidine kinase/response regulator CckA